MDGAPTAYLMNQAMYAKFQSVMDRAGINLASKENYGRNVSVWGDSLVMALGNVPLETQAPSSPLPRVSQAFTLCGLAWTALHGVSLAGRQTG